jgi:uncharacterized MAPEG superfamily protein
MVQIILYTALLYLIQLVLQSWLRRSAGDISERANKAVHNFRESLPIFLALAILSIYLNIEANTQLAAYWLIIRIAFAVIYISGISLKPASEGSTYEPQPLRGFAWAISIFILIKMGLNLL